MEMEVRLQKALEQKKADELRASTEQLLPRSRIATPGSRRPGTNRTLPGGVTPRAATGGTTPRHRDIGTPRSRPRGF